MLSRKIVAPALASRYSACALRQYRDAPAPAPARGRPTLAGRGARPARIGPDPGRGWPGCRASWQYRDAPAPALARGWPVRAGKAAWLARICPGERRATPGYRG